MSRFNTYRGCTEDEIAAVASDQGTELPAEYVRFLRRCGYRDPCPNNGNVIFYPEILGLKIDAQGLLDESANKPILSDDAVVFAMHDGFEFLFMRSTEGDDPPVYYFIEGGEKPVKSHHSFTEFLREDFHDCWN